MSQSVVAVLLRGVNLAGKNRLPMIDLKAMLADLGVSDVTTLLQSGNAVGRSDLASATLGDQLKVMIADRLELKVPVVVINREDLSRLIEANPLLAQADDPSRLVATILDASPTKAQLAAWSPETRNTAYPVALGPRAVYQWCPDGVHKAPNLLPMIERHWKLTGTGRNWRTTTKLLELMDAVVTG